MSSPRAEDYLRAVTAILAPWAADAGPGRPGGSASRTRWVHEFAGWLLRRWHDLPGPACGRAREVIMASVAEQAEEAAACLERTAEHLSDAVEDFVWLCGAVWPTRLDLKTAFLDGYGCRLSDAERRALPLLTARLAVSYLTSGITKQEPVLIERGRTALTHLAGARG